MASQADLQFQVKMSDGMTPVLRQIQSQLAALGGTASETTSRLKTIGEVVENVGQAIGGFFASFELAKKALEASDDLASSLYRIQRAAVMTKEEVNGLGEALDEVLSKSRGQATEGQILGIAEAAAKVGIAKESLASFSETIVNLGLSANGAGGEFATAIGQILNVTEDGSKGFKEYADEVAYLSKTTGVATDSLIMHARALANATAASNLSKESVNALAVITDSLPGRFNAAASSIQSMFAAISTDSAKTREGLRQLALATGESEESLRDLARSDPAAVWEKVLKHVNDLNGQKLAQDNFLSQFNIQGGEAIRVVSQLASKTKEFDDARSAQRNKSKIEGAAETNLADSPRTSAQAFQGLSSSVEVLSASIGKLITPGVVAFLDDLTAGIEASTKAFNSINEPLKSAAAYMLIFGGAAGGLYKTLTLVKGALAGLGELAGIEKILKGEEVAAEGEKAVGGITAARAAMAGLGTEALGVTTKAEGAMSRLTSMGSAMVNSWLGVSFAIGNVTLAIVGLIEFGKQLDAQREKGHSWSDIGLALGANLEKGTAGAFRSVGWDSAAGVFDRSASGYDAALRNSMQGQKDSATGAFSPESIAHNWSDTAHDGADRAVERRKSQAEEQAKEDAKAKSEYDSKHSLSDFEKQTIGPALAINEATKALDAYRGTLAKIQNMTEGDKSALGITDADLARLREGLILQERKADPIANQIRLGNLALDQARATTAEARAQVSARDALTAAIEKDASIANDPSRMAAITGQVFQKATIETNNALQDLNRGLDEEIAKMVTVGVQAQNELDIAIKLAAFRRDHVGGDTTEYETKLRTQQSLQNSQGVMSSYLPQEAALKRMQEEQEKISKAESDGLITANMAAAARQKLTAETLNQVSPLGEIVKNSQRELEYAGMLGPYREEEIAALKTINQLKDQGMFADKDGVEKAKQLQDALTQLNKDMKDLQTANTTGFNGFVNKVGTVQQQIGQIQESFADGVSNALVGALSGKRHAFAEAGKAFGEQLLKMGVNGVMAEMMKATGLAGPNKALEDKVRQDQLKVQTIAQAQMTVTQANINIGGKAAEDFAKAGGVNTSAPDAKYGTGLAAGNGPTNLQPGVTLPNIPLTTPHGLTGGTPEDFANDTVGQNDNSSGTVPKAWDQNMGNAAAIGGTTANQISAANAAMAASGLGGSISNTFGLDAQHRFLLDTKNDDPTVLAYLRSKAASLGIDPNAAMAVANSEGLRNSNASHLSVGDDGSSFGPFQMHYAGISARMPNKGMGDTFTAATGLDARDPSTIKQQIDYALGVAKKEGWQQWYGARDNNIPNNAGIGTWEQRQQQAPSPGVDNTPTGAIGDGMAHKFAGMYGRGISYANGSQIYGDSIAAGLIGATGAKGYGNVGDNPAKVLETLKSHADAITAQSKIVLSTGISNDSKDLADVKKQFEFLKSRGVDMKNVNVLGTGPRTDLQAGNQGVYALSQQYGANYNRLTPTGSDQVHPQSYQDLAKSLNFGGLQQNVDSASASIQKLGTAATDSSQKVGTTGASTTPGSATPGSGDTTGTPANNNSGAALTSGVEGLGMQAASHIPGAAPYLQGFGLLQKLFGSLFGGGSGASGGAGGDSGGGLFGGLFSGLGGIFKSLFGAFGLMHSGGVVGPGMTSTFRVVNPAIFNTALRYHSGLGSDEFPAILQKGERVLTSSQDQRATAAMSGMVNAMTRQQSGATPANMNGGGARTQVLNMTVNSPNAGSFRYSQPQVVAQMAAGMNRIASKHS